MTRENKIALVVGFAIVLVVGVLLSDHLAQAVRGNAADFASIQDPQQPPTGTGVVFLPLVAAPQAPVVTDATPPTEAVTTDALSDPLHIVASGETLCGIARRYYGSSALADTLGAYNALPAPDRLTPGVRLLVPDAAALQAWGGTGATTTTPDTTVPTLSPPATADTMQTYVVKSGDTLSEIAMQLMGTMHRTEELWALNKQTLPTPHDLRAGMELRYPTSP